MEIKQHIFQRYFGRSQLSKKQRDKKYRQDLITLGRIAKIKRFKKYVGKPS